MYWIVLKTPKWNELFIFWKQKVAKKSEIKNIVASEYYLFKRSGATKSIFLFFFARYISWFERGNKSKSKVHTQRNTCFSSKSILRCIRAKDIKTQNQIDMAEMGVKGRVTFKGKRYWYILTAEDAFNLFAFVDRKTNLVL